MHLQLFINTKHKHPVKKFFERVFVVAMNELGGIAAHHKDVTNSELQINLVLVDNEEIHELNKSWRGKDKETDVLSFPYSPIENGIFGEIFISLERAQEQANFLKHSLDRELQVLFIHGILHLFGYDHEGEKDFFEMDSLEKTIGKRLIDEKKVEHKNGTNGLV